MKTREHCVTCIQIVQTRSKNLERYPNAEFRRFLRWAPQKYAQKIQKGSAFK